MMVRFQIFSHEEYLAYAKSQPALQPYRSVTETAPNHPWSHIPKATIDDEFKEFSRVAAKCLKGHPRDDKELKHLYEAAKSLSQVPKGIPIPVAFVGPQGAGKSLLLCALFDCNGLSLTGAEGKACTSSVIRYLHYPQNQDGSTAYLAEIKFLDAKKLEAMFAELCRNYYYYHNDDDSDDEADPSFREDFKSNDSDGLKDTAEDILSAIFGSKDNFEDHWSADSYKSGEFVRLCRLKFEEALQKENTSSQGVATKMGINQHELLKRIKPFITQVQGEHCLWPLVDDVTVNLSNQLLEQGLEFIDLPGCGDTNAQRARHIEEFRERVKFEIIIADTARIESDQLFIKHARAAINQHGAENVQLVATKIDDLDENQLMQYTGEPYDTLKRLINETTEAEDEASEDDDIESMIKREQLAKYKKYLMQTLKQVKVAERAENISAGVASKLQGRTSSATPSLCHTSAYEYMQWTTKPKITFKNQPSLSPEETGIPRLREKLMLLPADQNLQRYYDHAHVALLAFVAKGERSVKYHDRDGDFGKIADHIESLGQKFLNRLHNQTKTSFQKISDLSVSKFSSDIPLFKNRVEGKVEQDWCKLTFFAFNRALKGKGIVPKGTTQAKGLAQGRNWNQELSEIMAPGFSKWYNAHVSYMEPMEDSLRIAVDQLHNKTMTVIDDSTANIVTIEKAKAKWAPYREKIKAKMMILVTDIQKIEKRALDWAIMQYGQHNNLVGSITGDWYDDIFHAAPALKPAVPGKGNKQKKQYMKPGRFQYQKNRMVSHFLKSKDHFVDRATKYFQAQFDQDMKELLDKHFADITMQLTEFAAHLRTRAPLDYVITDEGKAIRADFKDIIPDLVKRAESIQSMIPEPKKGNDAHPQATSSHFLTDVKYDGAEFQAIYDKMVKQKKSDQAQAAKQSIKREDGNQVKRIKYEQD